MYDYLSVPTSKKPASELDSAAWTSPTHPPVSELPMPPEHLQRAWSARSGSARRRSEAPGDESMTVLGFYDLMREHRETMRFEDDVWALARIQQDAGDRRLMKFILGRRDLVQLLERVGKAEAAPQNVRRLRQSRLDILEEVATTSRCTCATLGRWKAAADEVVALNGYGGQEIQSAVLEALELGRAKMRTIVIVGGTNRAKSFCLKPLALVFRAYVTPDTGTHQLADLKGAEVLWLNEFEYDPTFVPWRKLKDFLEGETLKVAVPKTQGANYIFDADAPVFCTGPGPVEHPRLPRETAQMDSRIRYFLFEHWFDPETCPEIKPCACCFAQWLLAARTRPRLPPGPPHRNLQAYYLQGRSAAPSRVASDRRPWCVIKPAGTYEQTDHSGCFKCGQMDHWARDCPL